jgi:YegS/Rv2252/BmrU family lipid kinase
MADTAHVSPTPPRRTRLTFVINPSAGSSGGDDLMRELRGKCEALGLEPDLVALGPELDLAARIERALHGGAQAVVAGGGDGTVSSVAACLAGTDTPLGVLPLGTLNHFAKDLAIPGDLDAALEIVARGEPRRVDVAEVNGRVFVNNSSLGLYPHIVRHREQQQSRFGRGKWPAMISASLQALQRNHPMSVRIEVDGESLVRRTGFVFIGNNDYCMTGLRIGERASIQDGHLSLYVTRRTDRLALLRLALRALVGRLEEADGFEMMQAASVTVRTHHRRLRVATDGEVQLMDAPLCYRIRPGALQVLAPA